MLQPVNALEMSGKQFLLCILIIIANDVILFLSIAVPTNQMNTITVSLPGTKCFRPPTRINYLFCHIASAWNEPNPAANQKIGEIITILTEDTIPTNLPARVKGADRRAPLVRDLLATN